MKVRSMMAALLAVALLAAACGDDDDGGGGDAAKPQAGGSLVWGMNNEPQSYDPKHGTSAGASTNGNNILAVYDSLVVRNGDGELEMRMAESVTVDAARTKWTIKLKPNIKFSDGTALDANAVKAHWDRMANPATAASVLATIRTLGTWAVTDPLTFVVTLPSPRGSFVELLAQSLGQIPSPTAVAQHGANYGTSPETTVGAGPFLLKEWVRNSQSVFARNPNYWQKGLPYLDTLTIKIIPDQNTMADSLTTRGIDIGYISTAPDIAKRLEEQGMEFSRTTSPDAAGMTFNMSRPPFDDVRVRRAFILATDAKDVIQKALNGIATPANGPGVAYYPEDHPLYDKSVTQKTNDLAEAQKLIDAYVAEKGQINTTATIPAGVRTDFGNALVQNWNRLKGVNVVADLQTPTQAILLFSQGNFAIRVATVSGYEYVDQAASFYQTGSPQNVSKYSNPKMDALLKEGFAATSVEDRRKYLNDLAKLVIEDAHSMRVYFTQFNTFYQDKVGFEGTFTPAAFPDPTTLWVKS